MKPTIQQAAEAHKAGKLEEAQALYRAILRDHPKHPDANHNLGVLAVSLNNSVDALPLLRTALEANPKQGQYWLSYIDALIKDSQPETARVVLEQGREMGLSGEQVDALSQQLAPRSKEPETDKAQSPTFTQQRKKFSSKKEKKKNVSLSQRGLGQTSGPSQAELNTLLAHYQSGQYAVAEKLAVAMTQKYPNHQFGWKVLGAVLRASGRTADAVVANQKAVALVPNDVEAHSNLGITLQELGRIEDAEASHRRAIALKPDYAEAHSNLGNALTALGRIEDAETSHRKAIALKPGLAEVHINLGIALKALGRLEEAEASHRQAIALKPDFAQAHSNLGIALQDLSRLEEAEASHRQAIALKPDYAEAHSNLGNALHDFGRLEDAEASHRQAIALKPDYAEAHSNLGNALHDLGRLEDAEASHRQAIALKPDYAKAHSNLGNALHDLGRLEDAEASHRQAIALKPDFAQVHSNLGNALHDLGRLEDAAASHRQAIALKPDFAEAHSNLGNALRELGRPEDAEVSHRQAIALKPDSAEAHSNLGNALRELGRLEDAEASYRQAIALKPDYADAYSNLGSTLQELGKFDEQQDIFQQVLTKKSVYVSSEVTPQVTALLIHGRSGSLFLHSLFDGHPKLATLPGIYLTGWFALDSWRRFSPNIAKPDWREHLVHTFAKEYKPLFDARCKQNVLGKPMGPTPWLAQASGFMAMGPEGKQPFVVDEQTFSTTLLSLLKPLQSITSQFLFELVHRAFEIAIRGRAGPSTQSDGHIFYHLHNPGGLETAHFLRHYPQARFLVAKRNPLQSLESWLLVDPRIKSVTQYQDPDKREGVKSMSRAWEHGVEKIMSMFLRLRLPSSGTNPHRGVKLEDVKRSPQSIIPQIAAWMGISDHPSMYESSFCGVQYWGPSSATTGAITGFDSKAIDKPTGQFLGPRDVVIFETLFWPFSSLYGYTDMDAASFRTQLSTIRPWLQEPLEFEKRLYAVLPEHTSPIENLGPYKRLHRFLNQLWDTLDRDGTYQGMTQPLRLD
jgi:Flp pilus assembly protein TadD